MDVDEYLRQKRELERKKDILEAKEKLKEVKEEGKRKDMPPPREHIDVPHGEPTLKPWMIWDIIVVFIVLGLFTFSYFNPHYDEARIKEIAGSGSLFTGNAVLQTPSTNEQQSPDTVHEENFTGESRARVRDEEEELPGPEFSLSLEDKRLGLFDKEGKVNGGYVEVGQTDHYNHLLITVKNLERDVIRCDVTKDIQIDTDFDGDFDAKDFGPVGRIEIDGGSREEIEGQDIPGQVEVGTYNGRGRMVATFDAKCYFCLDDACESIEERGESSERAVAKISINNANMQSATNRTNRSR